MTPEQVRMGRASLNWSLERLAEEAGVHRNTISNFEVGKYAGDPETVAAIRRALEAAGVIFEDGKDASVRLRRFQKGDLVKLRLGSSFRLNFTPNIKAGEVGKVVGVEPHPPQTGPTYRIDVIFSNNRLMSGVFKFEFELVRPATKSA